MLIIPLYSGLRSHMKHFGLIDKDLDNLNLLKELLSIPSRYDNEKNIINKKKHIYNI